MNAMAFRHSYDYHFTDIRQRADAGVGAWRIDLNPPEARQAQKQQVAAQGEWVGISIGYSYTSPIS